MNEITKYQKNCWNDYKRLLGLKDHHYGYGNPVKVHVPVDTAAGGVMIVGAYPTAHFHTVKKDGKIIRDVPVGDHLYPFSDEIYFDGSGMRRVKSGMELTEHYLKPLGLRRNDCWITDVVKVFLFKPGHIEKYKALGFPLPSGLREDFKNYAEEGMPWLEEEIRIANPKVILLLGAEVTGVVLNVSDQKAKLLMKSGPEYREFNGRSYPCFALPHPGIIMRKSEGGKKWKAVLEKQLELVRKGITNSGYEGW